MKRMLSLSRGISLSFFVLFPLLSFAQLEGFTDDFEDGSPDTTWNGETVTLWTNSAESIYTLTEQNGVLEIDYNRTTETGGIFNFTLPDPVDLSKNPHIKLSVKSSVAFTLDILPTYMLRPSVSSEIVQEIPGDDEWHTYVFTVEDDYYLEETLKRIKFYFDSEFDGNKTGTVQFDDLSIAGKIIEVSAFTAETINNTSIQLNWNSSDPEGTAIYRVYQSMEQGFTPGSSTFVTNTGLTSFQSTGLQNNTPYYFRILPVDTLGEEQALSREIRQETYEQGVLPSVSVVDISAKEYKLYEKVELLISLADVIFDNPYNPEDIDLRAHFISPSGDTLRVFGFYDDYQGRDQWKVRFAANETGTWKYEVYVIDSPGISEKATGTFTAVDSDHPGYVQISKTNPDYLEYSNGSFLYPMAVYYPWNVTESGLNRLQNYGVEFFGYWNGTYDNAGNGGGNVLLESMDSGLGRYDQRKSARIDQLLEWAEERNMKMMFAIWAHPFVRSGAPGWEPLDWEPDNPYQEIIDAEEFFTDSLAWSYQKKNFRYVVSRWGYSRALGIWEIMNEIHGTTGYVADAQGARDWTDKAHDYLKDLDPHDRPTTASYGGAEAWNVYGVKADMPNFHYYEGQGYPRPYNDNVRDGLYNMVRVFGELKATTNRPAFLGEAGYRTMFSAVGSEEYTIEFHNALWVGAATGIASTPFWWDFTTTEIFTNIRMEQYELLKTFVDPLNLNSVDVNPTEVNAKGSEAFAMATDTMAFGWLWSHQYENVSTLKTRLHGLANHTYVTGWYDTWSGNWVKTDTLVSSEGVLEAQVPLLDEARRDVAFRVRQIENGDEASQLKLRVKEPSLYAIDNDTARTVIAYVADNSNRLVPASDVEVTFSLTGPGSLSSTSVMSEDGYAIVRYTPESGSEEAINITAEAENLASASLTDDITTAHENEPEWEAPAQFSLHQNYPNPFNPSTVISYSLKQASQVTLEIFDLTGRKVATLANERKSAGTHKLTFTANGLSSGVYFCKLTAGNLEQTERMILLK